MRKVSIIWKISKEDLINIINISNSYADVLRHLGCRTDTGGNYRTLKKRLVEEQINIEGIEYRRSIEFGRNATLRNQSQHRLIPIEEVLIKDSNYNRTDLKNRILKEELLEYKCHICGQLPEWLGQRLTLILDHINGNPTDNRLENLRFLCPNCNSQTSTFSGRKNKGLRRYKCIKCESGMPRKTRTGLCKKCISFANRKVKERPADKELSEQVGKIGYVKTGKIYGVSHSTIRRWLKRE